MAERPMNPGDGPCSSEETRMEEPVVSREPAQADAVVRQPNTMCAQCKKEVKSPHLLCCLHSVCVECLPGMAVEGQRIKCGECGDTSTHCSSSSKGVENQCGADIVHCVPVPNGPLSRYMEGVKIVGKASNQASIPCGNKRCKTPDSPSTVYCTDCSIFMCERCTLGHELAASYEAHTVKNLQEMGGLSPDNCQQIFSKSPAANTCLRHRGEVLGYCCEQCSLLMCQACAIEFKPPHKPKKITTDSSIAEPHRQSLRTAHQATVCFGKKCEAVEKQLQTELRTVDQTTEVSLGGLNTAFQSIHEAVERRKEELHRQIINAAEEKKRAIGSTLRSVECQNKTAGNAGSTLEFLLKSGSTHDLLASKDLIQTHQSVLNSKWCEDQLENTVSSVLSFEAVNQEAALKAIAGFGIVTDGACPEKCTVEPKPDQLQFIESPSDPVALKVVISDSKDIACTRGGDKIEALLHPKPPTPGPAIKARVVDNDNGSYSVSLPSVYLGPCLLSIEVNGRDIRGSPFDITLCRSSNPKLSRNIQNINGPKRHLQFPEQPGNLWGVAVSPKGTIVVSDYSGHTIHVFSRDRKYIVTSFGTPGSGEGQLTNPLGLTVGSDGLVYVANCGNSRIEVFREDGTFVRQIGIGQLNDPWNVTIHNLQLYIADARNHTVSVYTLQGQHVRTIGSVGSGPGQFRHPSGVTFSPDGDMYVTDFSNHRVLVFYANGQYKREFGQGQLKYPRDIVITSDGDVLVAEEDNNRVAVYSACGNTNNLVHSFKVNSPRGLAIDNDGNILVTKYGSKQVTVF